MIPLPLKLKKNGFDYIQVRRGAKACIYAQWLKNELIAYEVFLIRIKPGRWVKEIWLEEREKFPRDEDFGPYAKAVRTLGKALQWYEQAETEQYNRFPVICKA